MACFFGTCLLLLGGACSAAAQNYASLRPQQRRLIDEWVQRLNAAADPAEWYADLPLSTQTTFTAVTHALLSTKLADGSSAIELVDQIDTVAGRIAGAGTDKQFRIYVRTNAAILDRLRRSNEFKRRWNNFIYHRGYPICFRSIGGPPSIQISLSPDATRADIDVDYHSTWFPLSLVNGHFTASNSDVRVGNNDIRHNHQWDGLQNWWRNLWTFPPQEGSLRGVKPAEAVYEFLKRWLVERKPFPADQTLACMPKSALLENMVTGNVASLNDVTAGVSIRSERLKAIKQTHQGLFALYDVRDDLAEQFTCGNQQPKSRSFGHYIAAIFRIKAKNYVVATLWQRERDYWKLVSYNVDPHFD